MTSSCESIPPFSDETSSLSVAGRIIDGLVVRDFEALGTALTDDVVFRALLPSRVLELTGDDAVCSVFHRWFDGADRWELVEAVAGEVGDRIHLHWRIRLTKPDLGPDVFLVEQQVYADPGPDGRLRDVALLCSGYRQEKPWP